MYAQKLEAARTKRVAAMAAMDAICKNPNVSADDEAAFEVHASDVTRLDGEIASLEKSLRGMASAKPISMNPFEPAQFQHNGQQSPLRRALEASGLRGILANSAQHIGRGEINISLKALLGSGVGGVIVPGFMAPVQGASYGQYGAIINNIPHIDSGSVPSVQLNLIRVKSGAAAVAAEGTTKAAVVLESVPQLIPMNVVAATEKVSEQVLADWNQTLSIVEQTLIIEVTKIASGICYTVMTSAGHFTAFVPSAGASALDSAAAMASQLRVAGASDVTIFVSPTDFVQDGTALASTAGIYVGAPPALIGVNVIQSADVPAGKILGTGVNGTGAIWLDSWAARVDVGWSGTDFEMNLRTVRGELRGNAAVRNATHVMYGDARGA